MFTSPIKNLKAFDLREGDIVADLGAGTGYYAIAAAHIVTQGKVYAVELHQEFVATIKNKIKEAGVKNIEVLWGNVEKLGGSKLADNVANAVIVSNVLFQIEDKDGFIKEIKRILKKGGKVLLVDWSEATPFNPKLIVPAEKAKEMFIGSGFKLERFIDAGAHHYGMILVKGD